MIIKKGISLVRISDQIFFQYNDNWFTQGYYQLSEIANLFGDQLFTFTAFGRIIRKEVDLNNLYKIPSDTVPEFKIIGPEVSGKGLKAYLFALPKLIFEVKRAAKMHDVIWIVMPTLSGMIANLIVPKNKIKVIQFVGETTALKFNYTGFSFLLFLVSEWLIRLSFKRSDLAVFVSNYLFQKYGKNLRCKVIVANESRLRPWMIRKRINYDIHDPLRVLYVGRLVSEKGVEFLLEAISYISKEISVELWIVGSGPYKNYLKDIAKKLGIESRVNWFGWIPWGEQLFKIMREADVLVLPSLTEGCGLCVLEAMSQSLPVIASKVGGIPEIVKDGISGLLVEPCDSKAIAKSIIRIARDLELRKRLINEGLKIAEENTLENQTGKVVSAILEIIGKQGRSI